MSGAIVLDSPEKALPNVRLDLLENPLSPARCSLAQTRRYSPL
jgi:hypothetical protein